MLTNGTVVRVVHSIVDTVYGELQAFYPDVFQDSNLNYTFAMRSYLLSLLDKIAEQPATETFEVALKRLAHYTHADKFSGTKGLEVAYEKNFDDICIVMNQGYSSDIREKTVREFYALYDYLQKKSHELHLQQSRKGGK